MLQTAGTFRFLRPAEIATSSSSAFGRTAVLVAAAALAGGLLSGGKVAAQGILNPPPLVRPISREFSDALNAHSEALEKCDMAAVQAAAARMDAASKRMNALASDAFEVGSSSHLDPGNAARWASFLRREKEAADAAAAKRCPGQAPSQRPNDPSSDLYEAVKQQPMEPEVETKVEQPQLPVRETHNPAAPGSAEPAPEQETKVEQPQLPAHENFNRPPPPNEDWERPLGDQEDPPAGQSSVVPLARLDPAAARMLAVHNAERAEVGVPPLRWDPQLAQAATAYAATLASGAPYVHASRAGRENQRENLSMGMRGSSGAQMMQIWVKEKHKFVRGIYPNISETGNWYDVSHYSQMVWRRTTRVGCGTASGAVWNYLVCRYSPPGNQDGKPVL